MSNPTPAEKQTGPIYGVELIEDLPSHISGMRQAMPSRDDLMGVKDYRQGQRVVAGYEVLLHDWRRQAGVTEDLLAACEALVTVTEDNLEKYGDHLVCDLCGEDSVLRSQSDIVNFPHAADCPAALAKSAIAKANVTG